MERGFLRRLIDVGRRRVSRPALVVVWSIKKDGRRPKGNFRISRISATGAAAGRARPDGREKHDDACRAWMGA
jgi:hypothetical protein